jgi:hypothetical protein
MNLSLRDVVCTSRDGDKFWKIPECYIRGNNIKYLRVPDEVIDKVVEEPKSMPPRLSPPPLRPFLLSFTSSSFYPVPGASRDRIQRCFLGSKEGRTAEVEEA